MKNSTGNGPSRVAILCPGDRELRRTATPAKSRFSMVFDALNRLGAHTELAVYHDDFCEEVRQQIMKADAVLVWFNPVEGGRDRSVLDGMLREVAASGVFVSTHPDIILKLGTKEVLYRSREIGWGCDTHLYHSLDQMRRELPARLADGKARVLKQYRGQSGDGVWKIEVAAGAPSFETLVRVRHAKRGSPEEQIALSEFYERCAQYFAGDGRMVDQAYQERLPEGMTRCYLVHDK
ncbi:MAG TPA: Cj0069 family protein, partial [Parvibaculum sp.]